MNSGAIDGTAEYLSPQVFKYLLYMYMVDSNISNS